MDNKKKIIIGIIAGVFFIIAFLLNLLFPPKPFIKSAHADDAALIEQYGYFVPGNQLQDSDVVVDHLPVLKGWLPDDYTYGDMLLDVASSIIGSSTAINSENVDLGIQVIQTLLDSEGFWIDTTSGFIAVPNDTYDTLLDFQAHHGYTSPDGPVVGNWYAVPCNTSNDPDNGSWKFREYMTEGNVTAPLYACSVKQSNSSCFLVFASFVSGQTGVVEHKIARPGTNNWQSNGSSGVSLSTTFQGTESLGYYGYFGAGYNYLIQGTQYTSLSTALGDLFGTDGEFSSDPSLNGSVYIDDSIAPINILDVPGNDGRNKSINRNTDINNDIDAPYGGYNNIVLSPKLEDIPNNYEYELPSYPEIPHDLPTVSFEYPEISQNEEIAEGLEGLSPLWVTLLTMGGTFIVLKVIL